MRLRVFPPLQARVLALLDGAAILVFTVLGVVTHRGGLPAGALAEDVLPLLAGWYAAAALFRLYRRPCRRALLLTWAIGMTAGVVLRAAILGRLGEPKQLAFLTTTLVLSLSLVLAARAVAGVVARSP